MGRMLLVLVGVAMTLAASVAPTPYLSQQEILAKKQHEDEVFAVAAHNRPHNPETDDTLVLKPPMEFSFRNLWSSIHAKPRLGTDGHYHFLYLDPIAEPTFTEHAYHSSLKNNRIASLRAAYAKIPPSPTPSPIVTTHDVVAVIVPQPVTVAEDGQLVPVQGQIPGMEAQVVRAQLTDPSLTAPSQQPEGAVPAPAPRSEADGVLDPELPSPGVGRMVLPAMVAPAKLSGVGLTEDGEVVPVGAGGAEGDVGQVVQKVAESVEPVRLSKVDGSVPEDVGNTVFRSDISNTPLSLGHWYHKVGVSYDISDLEFNLMSPEEQSLYVPMLYDSDLTKYTADWGEDQGVASAVYHSASSAAFSDGYLSHTDLEATTDPAVSDMPSRAVAAVATAKALMPDGSPVNSRPDPLAVVAAMTSKAPAAAVSVPSPGKSKLTKRVTTKSTSKIMNKAVPLNL